MIYNVMMETNKLGRILRQAQYNICYSIGVLYDLIRRLSRSVVLFRCPSFSEMKQRATRLIFGLKPDTILNLNPRAKARGN